MAVEGHHSHLLRYRSGDMATNCNANTNAVSRKRTRDVLCQISNQHMNQEMFDINNILLQHVEKGKREMEELSRRQTNRLTMAILSAFSKKLKTKDEEMKRMIQTNIVLEEKLKQHVVEAQQWRILAQSNEITANILRTDLELVLANRREENEDRYIDAAESCCSGGGDREEQKEINTRTRVCRYCKENVASVLILPCRHLCLCDSCGVDPLVVICPACGADRSGVFKVNLV
ncbi:SBP (S-ribonuclease binding protein) family protein [Rhynchospora pubera]|uniref:SBP (S-ribonuclease binding protein) family protein n=1 Tax=Rhynchospora pubera TaxID=906938 RepID=A0AAV8GF68_9POAL|nr:SBP (S-ribonuclease binding protein) family protein [Rhynchospora pubera]